MLQCALVPVPCATARLIRPSSIEISETSQFTIFHFFLDDLPGNLRLLEKVEMKCKEDQKCLRTNKPASDHCSVDQSTDRSCPASAKLRHQTAEHICGLSINAAILKKHMECNKHMQRIAYHCVAVVQFLVAKEQRLRKLLLAKLRRI